MGTLGVGVDEGRRAARGAAGWRPGWPHRVAAVRFGCAALGGLGVGRRVGRRAHGVVVGGAWLGGRRQIGVRRGGAGAAPAPWVAA